MATAVRKNGKSDLPYGIPVPGKQGLVTSPFSPDSGYIDVRSFPPGTEVKDPYTGKSFLTPWRFIDEVMNPRARHFEIKLDKMIAPGNLNPISRGAEFQFFRSRMAPDDHDRGRGGVRRRDRPNAQCWLAVERVRLLKMCKPYNRSVA
jgi:hypothetical protein